MVLNLMQPNTDHLHGGSSDLQLGEKEALNCLVVKLGMLSPVRQMSGHGDGNDQLKLQIPLSSPFRLLGSRFCHSRAIRWTVQTTVLTSKDVDVVLNDSGHLKLLYLGAEPLGQQNKDVHVLLPSHALDGRAPRVPRSPCFKVRKHQEKQKIAALIKTASLHFEKKMQRCSMRCFWPEEPPWHCLEVMRQFHSGASLGRTVG